LHWVILPKKGHNRTLLFGSILLKHWNQSLNICMHVSYLNWHEAGLCCYLMIYIENLLRQLQLFYFHLWPIYWFSLLHIYQNTMHVCVSARRRDCQYVVFIILCAK
jgi:hypothetical protein